MRVRYWLAAVVIVIAGLLVIDAGAFHGHYRKAAWREFQLRTGLLHNKKIEHPKKRTAVSAEQRHEVPRC